MRVAVFGPSGMLGRHVIKALAADNHESIPIYRQMVDLLDQKNLTRLLNEHNVETIINCAGVIPVRNTNPVDMIRVNSMFPHVLAVAAQDRLIVHVSTDCVFSGRNRYRYNVEDIPDPRDYYGKSKSLGEVVASNVVNIRTSFIGCDHGFMNWLFNVAKSTTSPEIPKIIEGYKNMLWTGSTVQAVAEALVALTSTDRRGVVHLSSPQTVSKYDLAVKLIELNGLDIQVNAAYHPTINRALKPTIELPNIDEALAVYKCTQVRSPMAA